MAKFKGLKAVARLMAVHDVDSHEVVMQDGTRVLFTFQQIVRGSQDALRGLRTYEGYVISNAVSGSEYAQNWIDMFNAVKYPVET